MEAVAGVVLHVVEVHEGGLAQVVIGELHVTDLSGNDCLGARRQRGVTNGQCLVVGEVACFVLGAELLTAQVERQHEIGLLDHLLSVEVEVGEVQEQGVLLWRGGGEVPYLVAREAVCVPASAYGSGRVS